MEKTKVNLFAGAKPKEPASTKKAEKKIIPAPFLGDKVQQFLTLKETIETATGQLKMLEGDIKQTGRFLFMKEYKDNLSTPDNFKMQDKTGATCMFIVMDKYTQVDETKAEVLRGVSENLLEEKTTFTIDADLVDKYGEVLSELICGSSQIAEADKYKLISGVKSFSVKKGTIDRLLQFENPREVFELINPVIALKK
jgi:hypothetical protein